MESSPEDSLKIFTASSHIVSLWCEGWMLIIRRHATAPHTKHLISKLERQRRIEKLNKVKMYQFSLLINDCCYFPLSSAYPPLIFENSDLTLEFDTSMLGYQVHMLSSLLILSNSIVCRCCAFRVRSSGCPLSSFLSRKFLLSRHEIC